MTASIIFILIAIISDKDNCIGEHQLIGNHPDNRYQQKCSNDGNQRYKYEEKIFSCNRDFTTSFESMSICTLPKPIYQSFNQHPLSKCSSYEDKKYSFCNYFYTNSDQLENYA